MTRVRITRMWHEVDFMRTNEVTNLDLLLRDDSSKVIYAIIQKKIIWEFEALLQEGMLLGPNNLSFAPEKKYCPTQNDYRVYFNWNTDATPLEPPPRLFLGKNSFSQKVVGVLTSHTNLQQFKRSSGNTCFMRGLTLENIRNLVANGVNPQPIMVVVVGAYITLPSRVGYYPANQSIDGICRAKALGISTEKGWYYLGCHNCTTKLVGNIGDHWCSSSRVQIDEPVPIFRLFYHANLLPVTNLNLRSTKMVCSIVM
ncbi:hypothetical protein MKW98_029885 [Papaver atlanticum]|uniref:Replication protein A 70 kDa DNA-binding subunit B/D first OB fold domain-containing protein n=1 Tax=Papaver atlanticum TaxID=357466 RepID=A0AAD4TMR7_9MAGN|nr:hypothetical protein MKW98_029885 [Papaver atlanticum]